MIATRLVLILKPNVDKCSIAKRPDPMRQFADRNGCDFGEVICAEDLYLVEPADCDKGKSAFCVVNYVDMIGNRSCIDGFQDGER